MNDIKKNIVVSILIILIIIMLSIIFILTMLKDEESFGVNIEESNITPDVVENETIKKVTIRDNYYTIKNIVEEYYSSLCALNKTAKNILVFEGSVDKSNIEKEMSQEKENIKNKLYSFFDEKYINETGLTTSNIQEKLGNYNDIYVLIDDMYVRDITINLQIYFIFGTITEKKDGNTQEIQLMIATDSNNSTFNIYTSDYLKKYNLFELSKEGNFKENNFNVNDIENRVYNKYDYKVCNDETYAKELLKNYTQSIKYNNISYSYNRLDGEYKTKKFPNISDYEKYIEENKKTITASILKQYKDNKYNGYRQYVCIDQAGKCYIFNETSVMDYKLILDEYTIDLPEFTEKYKKAAPQEKVGMNIEKIISAINNKDYKYVYSKLDDTFRNSQFPVQANLETYIENNLYTKNNVEYIEFSEEGGLYVYKIKITNKNQNNSQEKNLNIIMQLGEGTNFTMSFGIE